MEKRFYIYYNRNFVIFIPFFKKNTIFYSQVLDSLYLPCKVLIVITIFFPKYYGGEAFFQEGSPRKYRNLFIVNTIHTSEIILKLPLTINSDGSL